MHRDETFNLIRHLWTFQPTYIHLTEQDMLRQISDAFEVDDEVTNRVQQKINNSENQRQRPSDEFSGRWGKLEDEISVMKDDEREIPDIDLGKDAQRKAYEIQRIKTETLQKLQQQAESLDRTEHLLKQQSSTVSQADRTLDGMESSVGQVKNLFTPNLHKNKVGQFEQKDRSVIIIFNLKKYIR